MPKPSPTIKKMQQPEIRQGSPWNVVVLNDPVNLQSYVTMVFKRVFGYPESRAKHLMMEVHIRGRSIVWTGEREKAEFYVQQLHSWQLQTTMEKA